MKTFTISIEETLCRTIEITAENEEEAYRRAKAQYLGEHIVLNSDDFIGYEIKIQPQT